jgi:hypothetical protein
MRWRDAHGVAYIERFPFDFTIRFSRATSETEYSKIMRGFGDRLLYLHTPDGAIIDWFEVDLSIFRTAVRQHGIAAFADIKPNNDQATALAGFDLRRFVALGIGLVTAASDQNRIMLEDPWRRRAASFVGASLAALQAELRRTEGEEGLPLWYRAGLWRSLDRLVAAAAPPAMVPLSELPTAVAGRPVEHWCEVCGVEAAWGYGVHLLAGEMGEWYCGLHRPNRPPEDDRRAFEDWTADREREQW